MTPKFRMLIVVREQCTRYMPCEFNTEDATIYEYTCPEEHAIYVGRGVAFTQGYNLRTSCSKIEKFEGGTGVWLEHDVEQIPLGYEQTQMSSDEPWREIDL